MINTYLDDVTVNLGGWLPNGGTSLVDGYIPEPGPWPKSGFIRLQVGSSAEETMMITLENMSSDALGVKNVLVDSVEASLAGITSVKNAISRVSDMRSKIGGWHRRLESTNHNLNVMEDNMVAAESRIRDLDMAKGITEFTSKQILSQAAQAMMAQANTLPQQVMSLLRS